MGNFAAGSTEKLDDHLAHHAVCYNKTPEIKYDVNCPHVTTYHQSNNKISETSLFFMQKCVQQNETRN